MVLPAWLSVLLAVPVLLLGERLVKRIGFLSRFNIPAPVVGGLVVSLGILAANLAGMPTRIDLDTAVRWWTWLVTVEPEWRDAPAKNVNLHFLVAFFTCIGLNASWGLLRRGSLSLAVFLLLAGGLAVIQNVVGLTLSALLGVSPPPTPSYPFHLARRLTGLMVPALTPSSSRCDDPPPCRRPSG
jgi:ESS family glutamate:Na+ symporter